MNNSKTELLQKKLLHYIGFWLSKIIFPYQDIFFMWKGQLLISRNHLFSNTKNSVIDFRYWQWAVFLGNLMRGRRHSKGLWLVKSSTKWSAGPNFSSVTVSHSTYFAVDKNIVWAWADRKALHSYSASRSYACVVFSE